MLKKLSVLAIICIIMAVSYMAAFAGNPEGPEGSSLPAIVNAKEAAAANMTNTPANTPTNKPVSAPVAAGTDANATEGEKISGTTQSSIEIEIGKALGGGKAINTGNDIMDITSPDMDKDSTYKKSYILSGKSGYDDVVVLAARFNEKKGVYEQIKNTDGEKSWGINSTGIFSKEIILTKGVNKIMILSYRKSEMDKTNLQINCYTIELLDESIAERVIKKTTEISSNIGKDIGKGMQSFIDFIGGNK